MTSGSDWQGRVGRSWAEQWQRTDRSFANLTPRLLDAIAKEPGSHILDIGCGAGELSLALAAARPEARIAGIDIGPDLVAAARERASGTAVTFHCGDAGVFVDPAGAPDLLVSRHGVMFFADPPAVFRHFAAIAAPDARLVFSCFRDREGNRFADLFDAILPPPADTVTDEVGDFPPGPFAFADPDHVRRCLAGWRDVAFTPVDFAYVAGAGDDPVADALAFFARIGPAAPRLAALEPVERKDVLGQMADVLEGYHRDGRVTLPAAAWVISATVERSAR
ncbi:putative methyltransferase [Novosphingobium nitrogenifigens DSM 19370]|uniref:Putative methyltransferase n=1 Tax=Novosphingobium nitrogenifigens DSM 19370 TaxID=983920 RepID=F1Z831_9SPHN|nr:class I SAM-dependent methyltransferase [Novosphingobium nitrogenifigens]EGD59194.1 putative methyltransferase [Novosphingobium nitrogenifigens DSM 19370]